MKILVFFAIACPALLSYAADQKPAPDAVVVKVFDKPLPHEEGKRERFLWDNFANKPDEEQFNAYGADNWKDNFAVFTKILERKAGDLGLDSASLREALDLVLKDSNGQIAYLPVGAYQTTLDSESIWLI